MREKADTLERLKLEIDPGTTTRDDGRFRRVHFYESSIPHKRTGAPLVSIITHGNGMRLNPAQVVELRDWLDGWLLETGQASEHDTSNPNKGATMDERNATPTPPTPEEMIRAIFGSNVNIFNIEDLVKQTGPRIMGEMFSQISRRTSDIFTVVHQTHRGLMSDISEEIAGTMREGELIPENWPAVMLAAFDLYEAILNAAKPTDAEETALRDEALAMLAELRRGAKLPPTQDHSELARGVLVDYGLGEPGSYLVEVTETGVSVHPAIKTDDIQGMGLDEFVREYGPACPHYDCSHTHCARVRSMRVREDEQVANSAALRGSPDDVSAFDFNVLIPVENRDGVSITSRSNFLRRTEELHIYGPKQKVQAFIHNLRHAVNQAWYEVNR